MRRTQIYLDEAQAAALAARARRHGVTSSHMIRETINEYLVQPEDDAARRLARFHAAVDRAFGVAPYLADGATYVDELRRLDLTRARELERRRRG